MERPRGRVRPPRFRVLPGPGPWQRRILLGEESWLLRPIDPGDAEALREGFRQLSPEEVRQRFLHPLTELTPEHARELATIDPSREFALVLAQPGPPGRSRIGAVARVAIDPATREGEFAVVVGRPLAGRGLGGYLVRRLIEWCRRRRLPAIYGYALDDNAPMLALAARLGFRRRSLAGEPGVVKLWLPLAGADDGSPSGALHSRPP
ncbi:MAG: GNAT family N-acetyltransferase [Xanthomonadales bacterium]|nr:GNAT family N-acetyltransferase [Xanthomonadales bacterium]